MKSIILFAVLSILTFGCKNHSSEGQSLNSTENKQHTDSVLTQISDFPIINDTAQFIADIVRIYNLEIDNDPNRETKEAISVYKKVKIYGSAEDFILVEYDYNEGCTASFPWKYQLLLTTTGMLVDKLNALRFEFLPIFPNENPFLVTVTATGKGNGNHQIYKMKNDKLVNVLDENLEFHLQTYDAHEDSRINEPNELSIQVKDFNQDGFNDISFKGKIVFTQGQDKNGIWYDSELINGKEVAYSSDNPFKKILVEYIFLYHQQSEHFRVKENYREKYNLED